MEMPSIYISPSSNGKIPTIDLMVVLLPAPLWPMKAKRSPSSISRFKFFTAYTFLL